MSATIHKFPKHKKASFFDGVLFGKQAAAIGCLAVGILFVTRYAAKHGASANGALDFGLVVVAALCVAYIFIRKAKI